MRKPKLLAALLFALAFCTAATAEARPRWGRGPRVQISIWPRGGYYAAPGRGYFTPRPVYAAPPVYYAPPPAYYGPPPRGYYAPHRYHHRGRWNRW